MRLTASRPSPRAFSPVGVLHPAFSALCFNFRHTACRFATPRITAILSPESARHQGRLQPSHPRLRQSLQSIKLHQEPSPQSSKPDSGLCLRGHEARPSFPCWDAARTDAPRRPQPRRSVGAIPRSGDRGNPIRVTTRIVDHPHNLPRKVRFSGRHGLRLGYAVRRPSVSRRGKSTRIWRSGPGLKQPISARARRTLLHIR